PSGRAATTSPPAGRPSRRLRERCERDRAAPASRRARTARSCGRSRARGRPGRRARDLSRGASAGEASARYARAFMEATRLDEATLPDYLRGLGLVRAGDRVEVEPAGDGNINWVRRARSGGHSWIVKQARPALERFPEYRVTTDRILFEARWLETVRPLDAERVCPTVVRFDPEARVLVLEDLGR